MVFRNPLLADDAAFDALRRDLNRLMWMEPFMNRGAFDTGWSCRDHAFVLGAVLQALEAPVSLVHGKNMFVVGPRNGLPPAGLGQEARGPGAHTWVRLEDGHIVDLSPNLAISVGQWRSLEFDGVVAHPRCRAVPVSLLETSDEDEYTNEVNRASHASGHLTAVYLHREEQEFSETLAVDPFSFVNSPLTDRLRRTYDASIYLKGVAHLLGLVAGERRSLAGVSQNKAWAIVSQIGESAVRDVRERIAARVA